MKGIKLLLCGIFTVLIMIGERGIPVKLEKHDVIIYATCFLLVIFMSNILD
jgi:hypothetical protein